MIKSLHFDYSGPIDGHDLRALILELERLKRKKGPRFLHVITTKGKGLKKAEENQVLYHAPGKFDKSSGDLIKTNEPKLPKYQEVFGKTLLEMARNNPHIYAITPAMPTGSSLRYMMNEFPERAIDVGIAEQHALTLGAGMATQGLKVYACVYSTFLQRAYDQVIHDVALQNIPLVICIDRAGLVGEDGATHQGVFDIAYLLPIPNMTLWAPKDAIDLRLALYNSQFFSSGPLAIRYPRGNSSVTNWNVPLEKKSFHTTEIITKGKKIAVVSTGTVYGEVKKAFEIGKYDFSHYHVTQIKPLPENLIDILEEYEQVVTVEEGCKIGGFGSMITNLLAQKKSTVQVHMLGVPDVFIEHAKHQEQLQMCGLDALSIAEYLESLL